MLHSESNIPPLIKEVSEKFKEPLDMIKKLQDMEVLVKPSFPKIVVLGDASASSVIGTLVGLNLRFGLGIPIVLEFKTDSAPFPSRTIWLEFQYEDIYCKKEVCETLFASEIAGLVKSIPENRRSSIEVTLTVIQPQVSDLTVILLPEIRTHPNYKDKEKEEIELFDGYINRYTRYSECLFLHVLSCSSDINSCLSRKVLKRREYDGKHIVTVFTEPELCSEYMITQLTFMKIKTPFDCFFVDNSSEDSQRTKECVLLSKVDKDCIGFDAISKNLVSAMLSILFNPSSLILRRIESDIENSVVEIKQSQKTFDSVSDAIPVFTSIMCSASAYLYGLFITQDYGEYLKEGYMHAASNIACQFRRFRFNLLELKLDDKMPFLQFEIELLNSRRWLNLSVFIDGVVVRVLIDSVKNNQQLRKSLKRFGRVLVKGVRKSFKKKVEEMLDLEKKVLSTYSDEFSRKVNEMESINLELDDGRTFTCIEGLGKNIRVDHLKSYPVDQIERAFEMKKLVVVYWEFVVNRFVDYCALNLHSSINEMINVGTGEVIREHLTESFKDESKLLDVEPTLSINNANLERRTEYLVKAKKDVEKWQVEFEFSV
ncbi:hypothetical protein L1987_85179 [Smallanthus sonchifolius]|uniref:Uncharacterized protein n=1 Tax=Smallanthus sonchifolius TaxID=185202 RepID=A0ACB8XXE6_9ASTR|nr:hypothetical protein L1987_85179 [Smallanthus sonchifolius]